MRCCLHLTFSPYRLVGGLFLVFHNAGRQLFDGLGRHPAGVGSHDGWLLHGPGLRGGRERTLPGGDLRFATEGTGSRNELGSQRFDAPVVCLRDPGIDHGQLQRPGRSHALPQNPIGRAGVADPGRGGEHRPPGRFQRIMDRRLRPMAEKRWIRGLSPPLRGRFRLGHPRPGRCRLCGMVRWSAVLGRGMAQTGGKRRPSRGVHCLLLVGGHSADG
jgi:hypothetical protein